MNIKSKKAVGLVIALILIACSIGLCLYIPIYQAERQAYADQQQAYQIMRNDDYVNFAVWEQNFTNAKTNLKESVIATLDEYDAIIVDDEKNTLNSLLTAIDNTTSIKEVNDLENQYQAIVTTLEEREQELTELIIYQNYSGSTISAGGYDLSDSSIREFIMGRESGGSYSARNGQYYGAYQINYGFITSHGVSIDEYMDNPDIQDAMYYTYIDEHYGGDEQAAYNHTINYGWY